MRLSALLLQSAALVLLAVIAGCATPQYQTSIRLIPPNDDAGRACVQSCEVRKNTCQSACQTRYQACVKGLEPQLEARYTEALKQYELDLKQYAAALRNYDMQLRLEGFNRYPYYSPFWWDPWPVTTLPPPYPEPVMPTRESIRSRLEQSACQADCGCLPAYDSCYVGCGGQRLVETRCIRNCPQARPDSVR